MPNLSKKCCCANFKQKVSKKWAKSVCEKSVGPEEEEEQPAEEQPAVCVSIILKD